MYILKNALKCIGRAKGRNILIGVIVLVIAISCCIGLSIRQAAESAKADTMDTLSITATISFDRAAAMGQFAGGAGGGGFDRNQFAGMMGNSSGLSLEEYLVYAEAESVKDFYYSTTAYLNGAGELEPVSTELTEETDATLPEEDGFGSVGGNGGFGVFGGMGGGNRVFGSNSDFSVVGYSSEAAMTSFHSGTASIVDGGMFDVGAGDYACVITQELATFNDLAVGDTILVSNPNNEAEEYALTVAGIYTDSSANTNSFSMFGATSSDPANRILVSYPTLADITAASEAAAAADTENEITAISATLAGTYVFADVDAYEAFETEVRALGLDDTYAVSSSDITAFETSLTPLNTLSTMAGYFLLVILIIGAIILVVLNIFNVRERKYEIGVLTAMGMKKGKVALQFLTEIFVVTVIAIVIGAGVGAVSSVPVTNTLLENQVASQNSRAEQIEQNFGRFQGGQPNFDSGNDFFSGMFGVEQENAYVTEISSAMNFTVVLQLFGIGLLLTLISGVVSMLFVMRYEPLKILANRD